ncbi:low-density lipoprotein receptor class A repeat-containing protein [Sphingobacterium sp. xlx-130]|uniref:low-density lipoprotein receptor class A repeat-containing protein n=1 Tax=Sphingobacterium sp. xlx-130 TaxID=2654323 RepID=UPI0013DD29BD|nr:low-density lipoprotein receptor class A repeat-containing protein [Sphingobacterium sp. xlx-130]
MKKITVNDLDALGIKTLSREILKMTQGGNTCGPGEFQCGNGMCIDAALQMDGIIDCPDGSDEGAGESRCYTGESCTIYVNSTVGEQTGKCVENVQTGQCWCKASSGQALHQPCVKKGSV